MGKRVNSNCHSNITTSLTLQPSITSNKDGFIFPIIGFLLENDGIVYSSSFKTNLVSNYHELYLDGSPVVHRGTNFVSHTTTLEWRMITPPLSTIKSEIHSGLLLKYYVSSSFLCHPIPFPIISGWGGYGMAEIKPGYFRKRWKYTSDYSYLLRLERVGGRSRCELAEGCVGSLLYNCMG